MAATAPSWLAGQSTTMTHRQWQIGAEHRGFFRNPFKLSLGSTRQLFGRMNETLEAADDITDDLWDDLEETLITAMSAW